MKNKKAKLFISGFIMLIASTVFAQSDEFSISGEVQIFDVGVVYIYLVDEETAKTPMAGIKIIVIEEDNTNRDSLKMPFKFENVKEGIYAIRCYQDVNGNKKMDKGLFGPKEPWWLSWQEERHSIIPKFKNIAFIVESNIRDIQIYLNKN
ncbi:MAG: DUF2141 domain-containing protein [Bacteroidales bacterium]|nr:DUF2141 domain-containing protein [Bacteroidales bacterium]